MSKRQLAHGVVGEKHAIKGVNRLRNKRGAHPKRVREFRDPEAVLTAESSESLTWGSWTSKSCE